MSNTSIDQAPALWPFGLFFHRNKRKSFSLVERAFKKASAYLENENGEIFLGFDSSKPQIDLFLLAMPIVLKWEGAMVFTKGEIESKPWKLIDVLACYKSSFRVEKVEKYCQVPLAQVIAKRSRSIEISINTPKMFFPNEPDIQKRSEPRMVPCRMLTYDVVEGTIEEISYLSNKTRCEACPRL